MSASRRRAQQPLFEKKLFYGDNLRILRMAEHFPPDSVDLVYLDPPFKPNEKYNVLFRDFGGKLVPSASQVRAFADTWQWGTAARDAFNDVKENSPHHVRKTVEALHSILGFSNMFAYMAMMAPRLVELHKVMKPTGSLYLHCDSAASHYLKVLLDAIFGGGQFQNEVIWHYRGAGVSTQRWGRRHDVLLFYTKGDSWTFNVDPVRTPYSAESMERLKYKAKSFRGDKTYDSYEPNPLGKHPDDVFDMQPIMPSAKERLGYPTQKPLALLERIVAASSNPGDVVLDPFCGCGTTIAAAEKLGRQWLGIDVTYDAIPIIRERLAQSGVEDKRDYEVWGSPETSADAAALAAEDPYQFQWWAVKRLGGKETDYRKGADKGVDGRLTLVTDAKDRFPQAVVSVKAGKTGPNHVRELAGTIRAQKAVVGVLVVLRPPTKGMREAAESEGGYPGIGGQWCPRIQILTAADIIAGIGVKAPAAESIAAKASVPTTSRAKARRA